MTDRIWHWSAERCKEAELSLRRGPFSAKETAYPCRTTSESEISPSSQPSAQDNRLQQNRRGSETILYVDDEAPLREVIAELLREFGYRVLPAATPAEAISISASYAGDIDLLLIDVVMPGMTGPQLAAHILESRPRLQVLYVSGYSDHILEAHGLSRQDTILLQKPFSVKVLTAKIHEVMQKLKIVDSK